MPKTNNIQRYKQTLQKQINFSFSQLKSTTLLNKQPLQALTASQKRSLGMWVNTVLQLQSQQFLHALKHCRKYTVGQLNQYMIKHYGHLKAMIRYYVIGALLDYEQVPEKTQESSSMGRECVFLNIVIEELTNRFFRQSQWLHKISHHPSFVLFSIFDSYLRGYTTIRQIKQITQKELLDMKQMPKSLPSSKKTKKLGRLLNKKLSNNLQGKDPRIYQQNLQELMLRVNLVNFQEIFAAGKSTGGSHRYQAIDRAIVQYQSQQNQREQVRQTSEIDRSRRGDRQLELMTEDYEIKQKSEMMSRRDYSTDAYPHTQRKDYKSTCFEEAFASTPQPLSDKKIPKNEGMTEIAAKYPQTQAKYGSASYRPNSIPHTEAFKASKQNRSFMQNQLSSQLVFQSLHEIERNKTRLTVRGLIMRQLEVIKQEKRKAHIHYLRYV